MKNYIYLPDNPTEADYFKLFFDSDLVEHILEKKHIIILLFAINLKFQTIQS